MIYNNITSTIKIIKYWKLTEALVSGSPQHRGEEKFSVPGHGHGTLGHLPLETVISSLVVVITSSQTFWQFELNSHRLHCFIDRSEKEPILTGLTLHVVSAPRPRTTPHSIIKNPRPQVDTEDFPTAPNHVIQNEEWCESL